MEARQVFPRGQVNTANSNGRRHRLGCNTRPRDNWRHMTYPAVQRTMFYFRKRTYWLWSYILKLNEWL